jgi:hypothetical protein
VANPDQFAKRITKIASGVTLGAARLTRNAAIGVIQTVVRTTPVDTGLARSNWVASIGSPDLSDRAIRSRTEVVSEARSKLSVTVIRDIINRRDQVEIHIANGGPLVPYLFWLNQGSSRQAPAGFVELALIEGAAGAIKRSRLLIGTRGSRAKDVL